MRFNPFDTFRKVRMQNVKGGKVYDDLQVSVASSKLPTNLAPAWVDYAYGISNGITYPVLSFGVNELMYFFVQSSHAQKLSSIMDNHFHYTIPTNATGKKFKFRLDVIGAGIGVAFAVPAGSPFTAEKVLDGTEANKHKLLDMADIPGINSTVSSWYNCKLTRVAASSDEYAGRVYVGFTDCHIQKDTEGSRQESVK